MHALKISCVSQSRWSHSAKIPQIHDFKGGTALNFGSVQNLWFFMLYAGVAGWTCVCMCSIFVGIILNVQVPSIQSCLVSQVALLCFIFIRYSLVAVSSFLHWLLCTVWLPSFSGFFHVLIELNYNKFPSTFHRTTTLRHGIVISRSWIWCEWSNNFNMMVS